MMEETVKIDLVKLIRQAWPQLPAAPERELLLHWLDRMGNKSAPVQVELTAVQPGAPVEDLFCPRCGYETVLVVGEKGVCQTCHLSWPLEG